MARVRNFSEFLLTFSFFITLCECDSSVPAENHNRPHITNDNFVTHRDSGERFLINFYGEGCAKCEMYLEDFDRVETALKDIDVGMYDCNSKMVIQGMAIRKVPSLLYFRNGVPTYFEDEPVAEDIIEWVVESHDPLSTELHDDTFEHLTQASTGSTTGDWMVIFCIKAHTDCTLLIGMLEHIGLKLQNKVNAAWVDINHNHELKDRFRLKGPTQIMYIRHGKKYQYHLPDMEFSNLLAFASGAYQHSRAETVDPPKTPFDKVTEKIAEKIKPAEGQHTKPPPMMRRQADDAIQSNETPKKPFFLIAGVCAVIVIALLAFLLLGRGSGGRQIKKGV